MKKGKTIWKRGKLGMAAGILLFAALLWGVLPAAAAEKTAGPYDLSREKYDYVKDSGYYFFYWKNPDEAADYKNISVWMKKDGGSSLDLTEEKAVICDKNGVRLSERWLSNGEVYKLQVKYQGGVSEILRFRSQNGVLVFLENYVEDDITRPEKNEILSLEPGLSGERIYAAACPAGGSTADFVKKLSSFTYKGSTEEKFRDTEEDPAVSLSVLWNVSGLNANTPGVYLVTGGLKAPEGYVFGENLKLPTFTAFLSVQSIRSPRMQTYYKTGNLCQFPMVLDGFTQEERREFRVYLKEDSQEWKEIGEPLAELKEEGLVLDLSLLAEGCHYAVTAEYPGGETGIYSFDYAEKKLSNGQYSWESRVEPETFQPNLSPAPEEGAEQYLGGMYAGGSAAGTTSQEDNKRYYSWEDYEKEKQKYAREKEAKKDTVYTGTEIADLLKAQGETVEFEKDGISVYLKKDFLEGLQLGAEDQLEVSIVPEDGAGFRLTVEAKGEEVTEIGETEVKMSVNPEELPGAVLHVVDEEGTILGDARWEEEQEENPQAEGQEKIVSFVITRPGTYRLDYEMETVSEEVYPEEDPQAWEEPSESIEETGMTSIVEEPETEELPEEEEEKSVFDKRLLLVIPVAVLTVGILFFLIFRRKAKKRRRDSEGYRKV